MEDDFFRKLLEAISGAGEEEETKPYKVIRALSPSELEEHAVINANFAEAKRKMQEFESSVKKAKCLRELFWLKIRGNAALREMEALRLENGNIEGY